MNVRLRVRLPAKLRFEFQKALTQVKYRAVLEWLSHLVALQLFALALYKRIFLLYLKKN